MREIKFRAWDKLHGCFQEGDIIREHVIGAFIDNPEYIVTQYTGMKDKNGVDIYEGDMVIIPRWSNQKRKIYYHAGMFKVENGASGFSLASTQGEVHCEVVGNIYENPELLKGVK